MMYNISNSKVHLPAEPPEAKFNKIALTPKGLFLLSVMMNRIYINQLFKIPER